MLTGTRMKIAIASLACAAAVAAAPAALAQTPQQHGASTSAPSQMDMKSMMKDMNDKMGSMPMTGNPDIDFAMMMRVHHLGAIQMAEAQLKAGKEPRNAFAGPPSAPVEVVSPGTVNDVESTRRAGKLLYVCFLQDSSKAPPHAALGMAKVVTVK